MAINKKLLHFATKTNFSTQLANSNIDSRSIVFIKDTGEIWTHDKLYSCASWGTNQTNYVPLTISGVSYNLSKDGHTHSYLPISGSSYIQSTGYSTSWGVTNGTSTGAFNAIMGTGSSATWLLSGTSGGTFRVGIQALDSSGTMRFYVGGNYMQYDGTNLYLGGNLVWNSNNHPTTLSGYGITDALLASSYTAADVLTKIKTVDGSGSGLDADTLDGVHYQNILERGNSGFSKSGTATGWFRIASFLLSNGDGQDCILIINRTYNNAENETYKFSISAAYNGGINITQLSGYAKTRLIDKIRVDYINSGASYIELHISTSTTNNDYRWSTVGGATSYTAWTAVSDTPNGTSYEFTTVNGCKSDRGFTGNIVGNASTATTLSNIPTTFTGTYPLTVNVSGTIYSHTGMTFNGTTGNLTATSFTGSLNGNASTVSNGVYTNTDQTITGTKYFTSTLKAYANSNTSALVKLLSITNGSNELGSISSYNAGSWNQDMIFSVSDGTAPGNVVEKLRIKGSGGLTTSYSITASSFVKSGSSDSYILLGGGGHKALSTFTPSLVTSTTSTGTTNVATTNTNTYLNIVQGGTSTGSSTQVTGTGSVTVSSDASGKLIINGIDSYLPLTGGTMTGALNFKNGTWNNVGDDAAIGDINVAGQLGIKALNTTNPGIAFYNNSAVAVGNLISNAGTLQWSGNTIWHSGNDGNGSGLDADLLDGMHKTAFPQYYHYGTTSTGSGWYKIKILSTTSWMVAITVKLYQSYGYNEIVFSGYQYGASYWYSPNAILKTSSGTSITVHFGYDSASNLWVAVPAGNYTGMDIHVTNGHSQVADWSNNISVINESTLTGTIQKTQTIYRPLNYNENASSATALTSSAGSNTNPIYFSSGKPVASNYSFGNANGNIPISNGTLNTNLNADLLDGYHASSFIKTNGTINNNIDSDYGEGFVTFDPVPSGTLPISSANIRTINIGNNFVRRTQLAFNYESDHAYFRRRDSSAWSTWREFIHSGNIGSQSVNYATSAGNANTVDSQHFTYSNTSDSPTYLWGTNTSGTNFLVNRANMSVNYAASSGKTSYLQNVNNGVVNIPGTGQLRYDYHVNNGTAGLFPTSNNANSIVSFNKHDGSYDSQLGFSSNGNVYYRNFNGTAIDTTTAWKILLDSGNYSSYALPLSGGTLSGSLIMNNKLTIDNSGRIYPSSTSVRSSGIYGAYDSTKIGHIWSMGPAYTIPDDGSTFGNLFGLAYKHTNNATGGTMSGGHQVVWVTSGSPKVALGELGVWASGGFYKNGSSDSYVLLGGGGHLGYSKSGGANALVQRDANGYIANNYFYTSSGGAERNASGLGYIAGFNTSDYYIRSYTSAAVKTWLGLGSNAYTSTAYLPLSGGVMTGGRLFNPAAITKTVGTIHLVPNNTTADWATSITFSGQPNVPSEAQAGIYVQGSGSYGTKMYLVTTNSHATGPSKVVLIDHNAAVTGTSFNGITGIGGSGSSTTASRSDHTHSYLPLTGGTLTGAVTATKFCAGYDSGVPNSINCSGWFRSSGATGWINDTYGGGITMIDSTYVRVLNSKAFKVTSSASDSINTDGGIQASGKVLSLGYRHSNINNDAYFLKAGGGYEDETYYRKFVSSTSGNTLTLNGIYGRWFAVKTYMRTSGIVKNYFVHLTINIDAAMCNTSGDKILFNLPTEYRPCFGYGTSNSASNALAFIMVPVKVGLGGSSNHDYECRIYTDGAVHLLTNSGFSSEKIQIQTEYMVLNSGQGSFL